MQINLETADNHAIKSYSDTEIKIGEAIYQRSVIVSRQDIITPWPVVSLTDLDEHTLEPLLQLNPEVIIIGHKQTGRMAPIAVMQYLSNLRVGIECMSIGAASRTFNVLLSEQRAVVVGFIF